MNSPFFRSLAFLVFALPTLLFAVSVAERSQDPSVEAEKSAFKLAEGYEVNFFASEELGIANPIAIRWDTEGRLWVLTTLAYAQLEPGQKPNDKLLILEDTDQDGMADVSQVWAEGLNMPTGFALGHGGVYLSEGTDLLFLEDRDKDGKADHRRMLLSGFGTGDTHQNINSLSWGPAGDLWFTQGLHNMSRVETPWGIVRGEEAGFYRLRVKDLRLEPFCMHSMASQNPWGLNFGPWGELFVKSNNRELGFITPGLTPTEHYQNFMRLGTMAVTPGKSMGCEIVDSSHLPNLKDHVLIAGYYSNRITAYPMKRDGSGFALTEGKEVLVSDHASFRPVEVKIGPDGAIYVADWFNPIIGHYQASLRHPDRDKAHGRIWRITAKDQNLVPGPNLASLDVPELIEALGSPERWTRYQAKRRLSDLAEPSTEALLQAFDATMPDAQRFELAGVLEAHGLAGDAVISKCLSAETPGLRAYGARMIGRWHHQLEAPLKLLKRAVADPEPQVRLEAVVAASHIPERQTLQYALRVADQPMDRFIEAALIQCVHSLADVWLPALEANELGLDSNRHLTFALSAFGGEDAARILDRMLEDAEPGARRELLLLLAEIGEPAALERAITELPADLELLTTLRQTWNVRNVRPSGNVAVQLRPALGSEDAALQTAAVQLAGLWRVQPLTKTVRDWAISTETPSALRAASITAMARLQGKEALEPLQEIAKTDASLAMKRAALQSLVAIDIRQAATISAELLATTESVPEASALLAPYLGQDNGVAPLAKALDVANLTKDSATHLSQALTQAGRTEPELTRIINRALGIGDVTLPYDPTWVAALANEVRAQGDAKAGKAIYERPLLGCIGCHAIQGQGGILGPDLTTVGSGLPLDLIIESVLWPNRQLKEGYFSIQVTTKDGQLYNGYRDKEDANTLWVRDVATQQTVPVPKATIQKREDVGTLMPAGLSASLSREELRDLIRYLSELRG